MSDGAAAQLSERSGASSEEMPNPMAPSPAEHTLSRQEHLSCEELCDSVLCDALAALGRYNGSVDDNHWRFLDRRDQLTVYRREQEYDDAPATSSVYLLGTGYISTRMEDIVRGLYCDTAEDLASIEAILSGGSVLDGAVLHAFETRGPETPFRFAGVKWCATQDTVGGASHYDLLTFERMGVTLDSDNIEVAYHVVTSLPDHPDWPQSRTLQRDHGDDCSSILQRRLEPFAVCYLYRKVSDDLVLCFIQAEYWGTRQRDFAQDVLASRILMVSNAAECCDAKVLTKMLEHCRDVPVQRSKMCLRCQRTPKRHTLQICGACRKSVCRACCVEKALCRINQATKSAKTKAFCTKCLERANVSVDPTSFLGLPEQRDTDDAGQRTRHHHHHYHHDSRAFRRVASMPEPNLSYNYDGLLRKCASNGSSTSTTSSGRAADEGHAANDRQAPVAAPVRGTTSTTSRTTATNNSNNADLYLTGRNQIGDEAQRQFQRHLERHKMRDLALMDEEKESSQRPQFAGIKAVRRATSTVARRALTSSVGGPLPNPIGQVDSKKNKVSQDFYQDLYA